METVGSRFVDRRSRKAKNALTDAKLNKQNGGLEWLVLVFVGYTDLLGRQRRSLVDTRAKTELANFKPGAHTSQQSRTGGNVPWSMAKIPHLGPLGDVDPARYSSRGVGNGAILLRSATGSAGAEAGWIREGEKPKSQCAHTLSRAGRGAAPNSAVCLVGRCLPSGLW